MDGLDHPAPRGLRPAVFLDRDGTIIVEKHYLKDPDQVELLPGAGPALRRLQQAGWPLFVVTNQSGIGRGYFTVEDLQRVHDRMLRLLSGHGVRFEKIYWAPEAPGQPSHGRKPSPQFLFEARDAYGLDLSASVVIGDKLIDLECGWNGGVKTTILVRTGYGAELEREHADRLRTARVVDDLPAAADLVLGDSSLFPPDPLPV